MVRRLQVSICLCDALMYVCTIKRNLICITILSLSGSSESRFKDKSSCEGDGWHECEIVPLRVVEAMVMVTMEVMVLVLELVAVMMMLELMVMKLSGALYLTVKHAHAYFWFLT